MPIFKVCSGCGGIFPPAQMKPGRGRCVDCAKEYERVKSRARRAKQGTTKQRGYGKEHEQRRKVWARSVNAGLVSCARCHLPIHPGEPWDLGHEDGDRSRYSGPEHARCNRATRGRAELTGYSREW
jgi:hypothetical protein